MSLALQQKVESLITDSNSMHTATLASCFRDAKLKPHAKEALVRHGHMTVAEALTKVANRPIEDKDFFEDITLLSEVECPRINLLYVLWPFYDAALNL